MFSEFYSAELGHLGIFSLHETRYWPIEFSLIFLTFIIVSYSKKYPGLSWSDALINSALPHGNIVGKYVFVM